MIYWFIYFPLINTQSAILFPQKHTAKVYSKLKKSCMPNVCSNTIKPVLNHVSLLKCIGGSMQYKFSARMNQISIGLQQFSLQKCHAMVIATKPHFRVTSCLNNKARLGGDNNSVT